MKKFNLLALLVGATLFTGIGATSLSAEAMKCGAGKCGSSMNQSASKCGAEKKSLVDAGKTCNSCDDKKVPATAAKCGGEKKAPATAMKCGTGKCA